MTLGPRKKYVPSAEVRARQNARNRARNAAKRAARNPAPREEQKPPAPKPPKEETPGCAHRWDPFGQWGRRCDLCGTSVTIRF